jgi:hypothetical protein
MGKDIDNELATLYEATGFKPLNPLWAKIEIFLGLFAAGVSMISTAILSRQPEDAVPGFAWLGPLALFVLGWYLALAGHRSHLYQSANKLAAYSAMMKRRIEM